VQGAARALAEVGAEENQRHDHEQHEHRAAAANLLSIHGCPR
jgi:hypothetical protein